MTQEKGLLPGIRKLVEKEMEIGRPGPKPVDPATHRANVLEVGYLGLPDRKVRLKWDLVQQAVEPLPKINVPQTTTPYSQ